MVPRLLLLLGVLASSWAADTVQMSYLGDLSNPDEQVIRLVEPERVEEYNKRNYTWP